MTWPDDFPYRRRLSKRRRRFAFEGSYLSPLRRRRLLHPCLGAGTHHSGSTAAQIPLGVGEDQ